MTKNEAIALGATGIDVVMAGLRPETLDYLRAQKPVAVTMPVSIVVYPNGQRAISDGRHRILLAREAGERSIPGEIWAMGPRGGVRWRYRGQIAL